MPGFVHWPLDAAFAQIEQKAIDRIVCLEERDKMLDRSPAYWRAIATGETPAPVTWHPIPDYGVAEDGEAYLALVREVAVAVRTGERVLVHCAGGCGRSGTFVSLALIVLGMSPEEAVAAYRKARGCGPESEAQRALVQNALS